MAIGMKPPRLKIPKLKLTSKNSDPFALLNRRVLAVVPHQSGKSKWELDIKRRALPPGKRISASGKVYYEYRKNRSDLPQDWPGRYPRIWEMMLKTITKNKKKTQKANHNTYKGGKHYTYGGIMQVKTISGATVNLRIGKDKGGWYWKISPTKFGKIKGREFYFGDYTANGKKVKAVMGIAEDGKPAFFAPSPQDMEKVMKVFEKVLKAMEREKKQETQKKISIETIEEPVRNVGGDPWALDPGHINISLGDIAHITREIANRTGLPEYEARDLWIKTVGYNILVRREFEGLTPTQIVAKAVSIVKKMQEEQKKKKMAQEQKDKELLKKAKETGQVIRVTIGSYDGDDWEQVRMLGTPEIIRAYKSGGELGLVLVQKVYYPDGRIKEEHVPTY